MRYGKAVAAGLAAIALLNGCRGGSRADTVHGRQLATVLGCVSCHGAKMDGHLFQHEPGVATIYSANASLIIPNYTDDALKQMLISGKRPDGSALWVMPAASFANLSDSDMRDLIAWLRTLPKTGSLHPPIVIGPLWQKAIDAGQIQTPSTTLAKELAHPPVDLGQRYDRGRYLARTVCAECHEPNLSGERDPRPGNAPNLTIAASYDPTSFRRLLRSGRGLTGADLGLMTEAAKERLYALSDKDIDEIHAYLIARSKHPQP